MPRGIVVLAVLAAVAAGAGPFASGRQAAANTWAGTWNSDFGKMTLNAGGSGKYEGFNPGTLSGTVKAGGILEGTWNQPGDPPKKGTFKFTLNGRSFSGE
jgi:hypothetical protein